MLLSWYLGILGGWRSRSLQPHQLLDLQNLPRVAKRRDRSNIVNANKNFTFDTQFSIVSNFLKGLNQSSCNILIGLASWSGLLGKISFSLCLKVKPTTTKLAGRNLSAQLCCYFYFWPCKTLAVICNLLEMWNISRGFLGFDQLVTNKFKNQKTDGNSPFD